MADSGGERPVRGRYLLLNTLVEGRRGLDVRLRPQGKRSRRVRLRDWDGALRGLRGSGWRVLDQNDVFQVRDGEASGLGGKLAGLQFPRCRCAFALPLRLRDGLDDAEWGNLMKVFRNIVYNECNSVSEIYNRTTLFIVPFMGESVSVRVMRDNVQGRDERALRATMIMGLEFDAGEDGLWFEDASATVVLAPESGEGPLGFTERRSGSLEELRGELTDAFHMRKDLLLEDHYGRLRDLIRNSLREVGENFGGPAIHVDPRGEDGGSHDLHDLQIYGILAAFAEFLDLGGADMDCIYQSMRDDLRSNAFTCVLLELGSRPPGDFVMSLLEGFPVKLDGDGEKALEDYRVGYRARDTNFYLSWNNLLILRVEEGDGPWMDGDGAWSFLNFALPRAIVLNLLAGELMYINSTYSELLGQMRSGGYELDSEVGEVAREMYVETALMFDLGYVQTPLLRKILERIVQQYGFRSTLEGLRSTLEALDASTSAVAAEGLNVLILIVGIVTVLATSSIWEQWAWWGVFAALMALLALSVYVFRDAVKSIYWDRSLGRLWRRLRSRGRRADCGRRPADPREGGDGR